MRIPFFTARREQRRADEFRAWTLRTEASIAARGVKRKVRAAAAQKGHATRVSRAAAKDPLLKENRHV